MPQDGVIKFRLDHHQARPLPPAELAELNAWRKIMFQLQLIGQDPKRYDGCGYGNISCRRPATGQAAGGCPFVVSGTQTGGLAELTSEHYTLVTGCCPEDNHLISEGPLRPSSESLTHGILYALDSRINFVIHAHSPAIWRHARKLAIPLTAATIPYGTPQMAEEVRRLYNTEDVPHRRIMAMGGHEDGILTWGETAPSAAETMIAALARAYALDQG